MATYIIQDALCVHSVFNHSRWWKEEWNLIIWINILKGWYIFWVWRKKVLQTWLSSTLCILLCKVFWFYCWWKSNKSTRFNLASTVPYLWQASIIMSKRKPIVKVIIRCDKPVSDIGFTKIGGKAVCKDCATKYKEDGRTGPICRKCSSRWGVESLRILQDN